MPWSHALPEILVGIPVAKRSTPRSRGQRGLTLMEVLIAVTMVGLLMVAISTSLSIGLGAMESANGRLELNRKVTRTQEILERQILNLVPAAAACVLDTPESPQPIPFFQGEPLAMRFVSTYSLQEGDRGYPRILEFTAIGGDPNKTPPGVRLIVNELPYLGPLSTGRLCFGLKFDQSIGLAAPAFAPIQPGPGSFVLADRLLSVRFRYLQAQPLPNPPEWVDRWTMEALPEAIGIELAPLPGETVGPLPVSLVLPLTVDRNPRKRYGD